MALIKCSECGREISDKAEKCINCGLPMNGTSNKTITYTEKEVPKGMYLSFRNNNTTWVLDGDVIRFNNMVIGINDIETARIINPTFGSKYISIKYKGQFIMLPFDKSMEYDANKALEYIVNGSGRLSAMGNYVFSETRLRCNVCKNIFCIQGTPQSLNGLQCPSCNSKNVMLLEAYDVPDTTLNVISFLLPIVGLVLYLIKREETPNKANKIRDWAIIGFIIGIVLYAILLDF